MNRNGMDAAGIGFGSTINGAHMPCLAYTWNTNNSATYGWNSGLFPVAGVWNFVACVISPANTTMYLYYVNGQFDQPVQEHVNNAQPTRRKPFLVEPPGWAVTTGTMATPSMVALTKWRSSPMP